MWTSALIGLAIITASQLRTGKADAWPTVSIKFVRTDVASDGCRAPGSAIALVPMIFLNMLSQARSFAASFRADFERSRRGAGRSAAATFFGLYSGVPHRHLVTLVPRNGSNSLGSALD